MNHRTLPEMNQEKLHQSPEGRVGNVSICIPCRPTAAAGTCSATPWARLGAGQDPARVTQARVSGGALAAQKLSRA